MKRFRPRRRALGAALAAAIAVTPAVVAAPAQAVGIPFEDLFSISVDRLTFGTIPFGSPDETLSYTITALADADLKVSNWFTPSPDRPWGQVASGACEGMGAGDTVRRLTAGSVCTIDVTFNPSASLTMLSTNTGTVTWTASVDGVANGSLGVPYVGAVSALRIESRGLELIAMPGERSPEVLATLVNTATVPVDQVTVKGLSKPFSLASSTCDDGIAVGGSCEVGFAYRGGADGAIDTQDLGVIVAATGPHGQKTYDSGSSSVFQLTGTTLKTADLGVTKELMAAGPLVPGAEVQWQVDVTNHGPTNVPSVTLTDVLYPGLTYDQPWCPIDDTWMEGEFTNSRCEIGPLAVGETRSFTISTVVTAGTQNVLLASDAWVDGSLPDPDEDNNRSYALAGLTLGTVEPPVTVEPEPQPETEPGTGASEPGDASAVNPDDTHAAATAGPVGTPASTLAQTGIDDPRLVLLAAIALLVSGAVALLVRRRHGATRP